MPPEFGVPCGGIAPHAAALNEGYHLAFIVAASLAAIGVVLVTRLPSGSAQPNPSHP